MEEVPSIDSKGPIKMKVCFVGDYAVGKTSVAERFVHNRFRSAYVPTIGTQIMKKQFTLATASGRGNVQIDMVIWDIMGQKGFRELLNEAYFHGTRAVLAVCDVTRDETLGNLEYWIDSVYNVTGQIPVRILGNKWDLGHQRRIQEKDIAALAKKYETGYDLTSAKTGRDVEKAFYALAERYLHEKFSTDASPQVEDLADAQTEYSPHESPAEEVG
jgi:small GTP-binding protein